MKRYLAYIRVSTVKQGVHGVSLQEQRSAIERYASQHDLTITEWFEEVETAAKSGRRSFSRLMRRLRRGGADGVIIHKVDRSARNLRDWSDLGEMIDQGVEIHFAGESLDMSSRGGRLTADIQAVIAADYIRNLREEIKKGLYGRLKQGIYPWPAPVGYRNVGKGQPKEIHPVYGPLVQKAFKLYNTGDYNLEALTAEMNRRGLRSLGGRPLYKNSLSLILRNPFYCGVLLVRRSGETFQGAHTPLITVSEWEKAQRTLNRRFTPRSQTHAFLYRQLFSCGRCKKAMIGERQKGHVYYRCHTRSCPTKTWREERLEEGVRNALERIVLPPAAHAEFRRVALQLLGQRGETAARMRAALEGQLGGVNARLDRLTDALVDGVLDRETYSQRKASLTLDQRRLRDTLSQMAANRDGAEKRIETLLDHSAKIVVRFAEASDEEKRQLLRAISSNRVILGNDVVVELVSPYRELAECAKRLHGPNTPRSNQLQVKKDGPVEPSFGTAGPYLAPFVLCGAPYRSVIRTADLGRDSTFSELVLRVVCAVLENGGIGLED